MLVTITNIIITSWINNPRFNHIKTVIWLRFHLQVLTVLYWLWWNIITINTLEINNIGVRSRTNSNGVLASMPLHPPTACVWDRSITAERKEILYGLTVGYVVFTSPGYGLVWFTLNLPSNDKNSSLVKPHPKLKGKKLLFRGIHLIQLIYSNNFHIYSFF